MNCWKPKRLKAQGNQQPSLRNKEGSTTTERQRDLNQVGYIQVNGSVTQPNQKEG